MFCVINRILFTGKVASTRNPDCTIPRLRAEASSTVLACERRLRSGFSRFAKRSSGLFNFADHAEVLPQARDQLRMHCAAVDRNFVIHLATPLCVSPASSADEKGKGILL